MDNKPADKKCWMVQLIPQSGLGSDPLECGRWRIRRSGHTTYKDGDTPLCSLARKWGTDKADNNYTKVYYELFKNIQNETLSIFEIGIFRGASLAMWREFFPNALVVGMDNCGIEEWPIVTMQHYFQELVNNRKGLFEVYVGDQNDRHAFSSLYQGLYEKYPGFESYGIIIDDGIHRQRPQQFSLGILWDQLANGGFYIIEDVMDRRSHDGDCEWGSSDDAWTIDVFKDWKETGKLSSPYIHKSVSDRMTLECDPDSIRIVKCTDTTSVIILQKNVPEG